MTTAIRCELHADTDSVRPIAIVRVKLYPLWQLPGANQAREYDLCAKCYEGAKRAGEFIVGEKMEVL